MINSQYKIYPWPLKNDGEEVFFGYVIAVGIANTDSESEFIPYADFEYGGTVNRYHLPQDDALIGRLLGLIAGNICVAKFDGGIYGKVWIKKCQAGHIVEIT